MIRFADKWRITPVRIRWVATTVCLALAGVALCADTHVEACDTPVFQQALGVWEPDRFQARVLHRGPLSAEDAALVETLRAGARAPSAPVNVEIGTIDLALAGSEGEKWLMHAAAAQEPLPQLALWYPFRAGAGPPLWSGPLTEGSVRGLLESPVRREIARRLMGDEAIVFVLLETGNALADSAAAGRLSRLLAEMEAKIRPFVQVEGLEPTFSMLRLPRNGPGEQVLVRALVRSEPDLESYVDRPIVFPVFGRGRVLCALVGKGINAETIQEVCAFLVGPCSCLVKAENPGFDLLMGAGWERVPGARTLEEGEPLPLVSVPDPGAVENASASGGGMTGGSGSGDPTTGGSGLLANSALLALAAIVAAGSIALRRAGARRGTACGSRRENDEGS